MKTLYVAVLVIILIAFLIFVPVIPWSECCYASVTYAISNYGGFLSPSVGNIPYVYEFRTGLKTAENLQ